MVRLGRKESHRTGEDSCGKRGEVLITGATSEPYIELLKVGAERRHGQLAGALAKTQCRERWGVKKKGSAGRSLVRKRMQ